MPEPTLICPHCHNEIKLTESLAAPLVAATRQEFQQKFIAERSRVIAEQTQLARQSVAQELTVLQANMKQQEVKLAEAQKAQAEILRKERVLADATRELELTVEKRIAESLQQIREKARAEAESALGLRVAEKEQTIQAMQKQIEELRRKAEQGSQQLQGEVQELELEAQLRANFPLDAIQPVPKGEFGGDVLHRVANSIGQPCGTILWESKRTKNWSDTWLPKLRDDQRTAQADIALLVSQTLPKDVETFALIDGVWVTGYHCAIPVAIALRHSLMQLSMARQTAEGQQTKMELVYQYLTGPRFRHRVTAIVEKFTEMQMDLDRERKFITKQWAKREEQIRGSIDSTAGLYGDLQGIAGRTLQEIEGLDMPLLEE